jgi:hypothetical protein
MISQLLPLSMRQVFSKPSYAVLTAVVAIPLWILFNMFDQLLFFQPVWIFYLPEDAILGFILTTIVSILLGILVSMNAYVIKHSRMRIGRASLFSGSALGIISGVCSSCSSIGFLLISTFGTIGVIASNFLTIYQVPLRAVSAAILILALYTMHRRIMRSCSIDNKVSTTADDDSYHQNKRNNST